jgi:LysM repeat protein
VVQSGDTLIAIAIQYGVDVDLLASENGITDPGSLSLGQELTIPFTAEELAQFNAGNTGTTETANSSTDSDGNTSETEAPAASSDEAGTADETASEAAEGGPAEGEASAEEEAAPAAPVSGKIAYPAFDRGRNVYDLWMVDLATGEQVSLSASASQPAFNKDGSLLAYRSWDLGTRGIFFRDFIGGRGGKVTNFVEDGMPTWSPDSFTFAFASRKEGDRVPRIYVGNQLGEDPFGLAFQGEYPSTFPDGRLVVKGCTPSGDCGIFTMGPSGGGENKISGEPSDTAPAPSPDGSKIAFMSNGRGGNNWEIWVMNADGSDPKRLTENGSNEGLPAWSPDGQSIAYVSDQGGVWSIWGMNADGSNQRKLADMKGSPDGIVLHDESNSKGWLEERISWAP